MLFWPQSCKMKFYHSWDWIWSSAQASSHHWRAAATPEEGQKLYVRFVWIICCGSDSEVKGATCGSDMTNMVAMTRWYLLIWPCAFSLYRADCFRLKNKLQYGPQTPESSVLAKIQHLEGIVCELESSERRLKRQLQELRATETKLRLKLENRDVYAKSPSVPSILQDIEQNDQQNRVRQMVRSLEDSEKSLQDKLAYLDRKDSNFALHQRIAELESSERGLRLKLEQLEAHAKHCPEVDLPMMLDSPEAILKQRVRDLEKMEAHLRQQVSDIQYSGLFPTWWKFLVAFPSLCNFLFCEYLQERKLFLNCSLYGHGWMILAEFLLEVISYYSLSDVNILRFIIVCTACISLHVYLPSVKFSLLHCWFCD